MVQATDEHEVMLGELTAELAGAQYCRAKARAGETVHFEREPSNAHDRNALRAENEDFDKVGYLPRRIASWLAPLIDDGTVQIDGVVVSEAVNDHAKTMLKLQVYLHPRGAAFLEHAREPETLAEALHAIVLDAYNRMHAWEKPGVVRETARRLWKLSKRDLAPQTRMLLALMPACADALDAYVDVSALNAVRGVLDSLRIGPGQHHRNATVFPLFLDGAGAPDYCLLEDALEAGAAEVTEMSGHGSVPEVLLRNNGSAPILLPEGEILTGAKQNRVVNITMLVAAHSEVVVPVSCVEQGRWSSISPGFRATHFATPGLRAHKCRRVWENAARSASFAGDQDEVWADVSYELRGSAVHSRTESLTDGYEAMHERVEEYRARIQLPGDAVGAAFYSGGQIVAVEFFDAAAAMQRLWPRMSEAGFFALAQDPEECDPGSEEAVRAFLNRLRDGVEVIPDAKGRGVKVGVRDEALSGSGLCCDGRILHLAAFPVEA